MKGPAFNPNLRQTLPLSISFYIRLNKNSEFRKNFKLHESHVNRYSNQKRFSENVYFTQTTRIMHKWKTFHKYQIRFFGMNNLRIKSDKKMASCSYNKFYIPTTRNRSKKIVDSFVDLMFHTEK